MLTPCEFRTIQAKTQIQLPIEYLRAINLKEGSTVKLRCVPGRRQIIIELP